MRGRDFQGFAIGLGRWLLGGEPPSGVQATLERQGGEGIVRVDLDPGPHARRRRRGARRDGDDRRAGRSAR